MVRGSTSMVLKAGLILRTQAAGRKGRQRGPAASASSVYCLSLRRSVCSLLVVLYRPGHSGGSKHNDDMRFASSLGTAFLSVSPWPPSQQEEDSLCSHRAPPTLPTPAPPLSRRDKHWRGRGSRGGADTDNQRLGSRAPKPPNLTTTALENHHSRQNTKPRWRKSTISNEYSDKTLPFSN